MYNTVPSARARVLQVREEKDLEQAGWPETREHSGWILGVSGICFIPSPNLTGRRVFTPKAGPEASLADQLGSPPIRDTWEPCRPEERGTPPGVLPPSGCQSQDGLELWEPRRSGLCRRLGRALGARGRASPRPHPPPKVQGRPGGGVLRRHALLRSRSRERDRGGAWRGRVTETGRWGTGFYLIPSPNRIESMFQTLSSGILEASLLGHSSPDWVTEHPSLASCELHGPPRGTRI
ncbi:uncharacterized protein LOC125921673 [Panthera uncia]|uniref:uncharacterized protein LOC125921673 n=1 Tax=Panthera uncia TaxID=29064 RepID=UPI0020FF9B91|nr:uncharacterized protein LOC125921673 [Panthera uncia]